MRLNLTLKNCKLLLSTRHGWLILAVHHAVAMLRRGPSLQTFAADAKSGEMRNHAMLEIPDLCLCGQENLIRTATRAIV